jgi:hypothetical protein
MNGVPLAPCPFCGETPRKLQHSEGLWRVWHQDFCYFKQVDFGRSFHILDDETVVSWNARVAPELICDLRAKFLPVIVKPLDGG